MRKSKWSIGIFFLIGCFSLAFVEVENQIPNIKPISQKDIKKVSGYGMRTNPFTHAATLHQGTDFVAPIGTSVMATADGVVLNTFLDSTGYGHRIIIEHPNNITTVYAHLDEILVEKGQQILQKDIIATVGNTGKSTGSHLHYEIKRDGQPVDPASFYSN